MTEIRRGFDPRDSIPKLEEEIQGEIANALSKTGTKCTFLFRTLEALESQIAASIDECSKEELIQEFNEVRELAREARRDLVSEKSQKEHNLKYLLLTTTHFSITRLFIGKLVALHGTIRSLLRKSFPSHEEKYNSRTNHSFKVMRWLKIITSTPRYLSRYYYFPISYRMWDKM